MADHATELDANESFEQSAAMFKAATGMLAPGKSEATGGQQTFTRYEVRYALWELWDKLKGWKGPQAIDAAVQGLVDAAEEAAKARDLDEIDGVLLDLDKALSTFRAGKPTLPAEVVKVLKQCEWEGRSADVRQYGCCPSCHRFRRDGHAGDCEYAALLAPYRKEQEDVQPN